MPIGAVPSIPSSGSYWGLCYPDVLFPVSVVEGECLPPFARIVFIVQNRVYSFIDLYSFLFFIVYHSFPSAPKQTGFDADNFIMYF